MTLQDLYREGIRKLTENEVPEAELNAWYLLQSCLSEEPFSYTRSRFFLEQMEQAAPETITLYMEKVSKREEHIPLEYILGYTEFMGLTFLVREGVLIPRQDTEILVEMAVEVSTGKRVLDLCTGSGCIAISLAVMGGYRDVTAADLSEAALKVAAENADHLLQERRKEGCRFTLRRGDLFEALKPGERFDVLTSNPPYIPTEVVRGLEPEVKDHEPWMALDGTEDGLAFYRRIAHESKAWLNPGACIYLEIGYDQGEAVSRLLEAAGFCNIEVIKDLPGLDRVVRAEIKK